jgi:hypothetical protein
VMINVRQIMASNVLRESRRPEGGPVLALRYGHGGTSL